MIQVANAVDPRRIVATPGDLVAAREARGMSQIDVSQRIKLQIRQVAALEEGAWDLLPGRAFVRGALRSYGKLVDADVGPLLEQVGVADNANQLPIGAITASTGPVTSVAIEQERRSSPMLWVVGGLAAAIALVVYFGTGRDDAGRQAPSSADPAAAAGATGTSPGSGASPGGAPGGTVAGSGMPAGAAVGSGTPGNAAAGGGTAASDPSGNTTAGSPAGGATTSAPAASPGSAGSAAPGVAGLSGNPGSTGAPTQAAALPAAQGAAPAAGQAPGQVLGQPPAGLAGSQAAPQPGGQPASQGTAATAAGTRVADSSPATGSEVGSSAGTIRFSPVGNSWVGVRDASGKQIHAAVVPAGGSATVKGQPPFQITIGNAHAARMKIQYEGRDTEVPPPNENSVIRMELP